MRPHCSQVPMLLITRLALDWDPPFAQCRSFSSTAIIIGQRNRCEAYPRHRFLGREFSVRPLASFSTLRGARKLFRPLQEASSKQTSGTSCGPKRTQTTQLLAAWRMRMGLNHGIHLCKLPEFSEQSSSAPPFGSHVTAEGGHQNEEKCPGAHTPSRNEHASSSDRLNG